MGELPSWVKVGAEVVCLRDRVRIVNDLGFPGARKGTIYTIADYGKHERGYDFIRLNGFAENHWHALCRFAPLVRKSPEHDRTIFAPLLKTELADA